MSDWNEEFLAVEVEREIERNPLDTSGCGCGGCLHVIGLFLILLFLLSLAVSFFIAK